jgi:cell shape-determining protein MreD
MIRYLLYILALYLTLPFNSTIEIATIVVFYVITKEDARFALIFAFFTGLLTDLYHPVRLGLNTIVYISLTEILLYLKKYLVLNPLTTIATFTVLYLVKTAALNILVSAQIDPGRMILTILMFFPTMCLLNRIGFGIWITKQ